MKNKEVGDADAVQGSIRGKRYKIMSINEPDDMVLMMITYGTLEHLEGSFIDIILYIFPLIEP